MAILNFLLDTVGQVGVQPRFIYLNTNNTVAQVTATGFLNKFVSSGNKVAETDMAVVVTRTTPSAKVATVNLFNVTFSAGNWSLTANSTPLSLVNGQIFVGNAGGVATGVTMSGDATVTNTGVLTIANDAITTAKILNGNVTLLKLASGITPSSIIKFDGKVNNAGGSASITIPVPGALATDRAFVSIEASTNAVSVQKSLPGLNTINVTLSADPGAATVLSYQLLRDAS